MHNEKKVPHAQLGRLLFESLHFRLLKDKSLPQIFLKMKPAESLIGGLHFLA
jgi:hypothetical protein